MDNDLHQPLPGNATATTPVAQDGEAGKASALIGSEEFVARVLRAMTLGARQAVEENATLKSRPAKP